MRIYLFILTMLIVLSAFSQENKKKKLIYMFEMKQEIDEGLRRQTKKAFKEAVEMKADLIVIHMNTYGGMVDAADSIRTTILNCPIPVYVYIENNAASAGALISLACDSIYMRKGSSIGAASVVDQNGELAPDKYQSYMRKKMRATAEFHGKDTIYSLTDTVIKWRRDPLIAEGMVDPDIFIKGITDTGKVITFSVDEAIKYGYCEGIVNDIEDVMKKAKFEEYEVYIYEPTALDLLIGFLTNPFLQGILIMLIIGGIYFELQSPGIGFPLAVAITAAVLYFAPLYVEGLADNWEILVFLGGIILIALEIFVIPGFGVAGISGIILTIAGLTLSMVENDGFNFSESSLNAAFKSLMVVSISMFASFFFSVYFGKRILTTGRGSQFVLSTTQEKSEGYVGVDGTRSQLIGKTGVTTTMLRPAGKVMVDNEIYDAKSEVGYIEKDQPVKVIKYEAGQIYVVHV